MKSGRNRWNSLPRDPQIFFPIYHLQHHWVKHSGKNAFFALNTVGSRFGCLHPITSYGVYSTLCLPNMPYGSELWSLSNPELNILECTHHKILCTIQGLPTRCLTTALQSLIDSRPISSFISQRQLAFINSIIKYLKWESQTLMRKESLLPGKTLLINSVSPPSNSYSKHRSARNPGDTWLSASLISKHHHDATPIWQLPPRWMHPPNRKTSPTLDSHLKDTYATHKNNFRSAS